MYEVIYIDIDCELEKALGFPNGLTVLEKISFILLALTFVFICWQ
jgi:hypothetical protein